jgi:hypothetical protein
MTPQTLSTAAAVILSLLFSYVPGLSSWYDGLDATRKRLTMLILLLVTTLASFGLVCAGWAEAFGFSLSCDTPGAITLIQSLVLALTANQSTYLITPKPKTGRF